MHYTQKPTDRDALCTVNFINEHEKLVNMTVKKEALLPHYVYILLLISLCQFLIVNKRANTKTERELISERL